MSTYLYELPTTGAISFSDFCVDATLDNEYTGYISEATQARANLREASKENKRTEDSEKDYLRLVKVSSLLFVSHCELDPFQVIDEYLPHLTGIMSCAESGDITMKAEPGAWYYVHIPALLL